MEVNGLCTGQKDKNSEKRSLLLTEWSNVKENQKPTFATRPFILVPALYGFNVAIKPNYGHKAL